MQSADKLCGEAEYNGSRLSITKLNYRRELRGGSVRRVRNGCPSVECYLAMMFKLSACCMNKALVEDRRAWRLLRASRPADVAT